MSELDAQWAKIQPELQSLVGEDYLVELDHAAGSPGTCGDIVIRRYLHEHDREQDQLIYHDLYVSQDMDTGVWEDPDFYDLAFWSYNILTEDGGTLAKLFRIPPYRIQAHTIYGIAQVLRSSFH